MLYTLPFCGLLKPLDLVIFAICNILFINFNYPCYSVPCINKDTVKSTLTIGRANGWWYIFPVFFITIDKKTSSIIACNSIIESQYFLYVLLMSELYLKSLYIHWGDKSFFSYQVTNFTNHRSISNTAIGLLYPLMVVAVPALKYPATIVLLMQPLSWKEFKNLTSIICYKSYKVHTTTINSCPYSTKNVIRNFFCYKHLYKRKVRSGLCLV